MRAILFLTILFLVSCGEKSPATIEKKPQDTVVVKLPDAPVIPDTTELERTIIKSGLVEVHSLDTSILVELKYSSTDNFMNEDVYGDFSRLYLQKDVAEKLIKAQFYLKEIDSSLSLLVYDGVRPRSIQQKMWDIVDLPNSEKPKFVSNPKNGSLHNYGAAVDLTIAKNGIAIDMGSPYDDVNEISYPQLEQKFLDEGLLTKEQIDNRKLLRKVMAKAGFFGIQTEWWHFNSCTRDVAKSIYQIVE